MLIDFCESCPKTNICPASVQTNVSETQCCIVTLWSPGVRTVRTVGLRNLLELSLKYNIIIGRNSAPCPCGEFVQEVFFVVVFFFQKCTVQGENVCNENENVICGLFLKQILFQNLWFQRHRHTCVQRFSSLIYVTVTFGPMQEQVVIVVGP